MIAAFLSRQLLNIRYRQARVVVSAADIAISPPYYQRIIVSRAVGMLESSATG